MSAINELFVANDTVLEIQNLRSDISGEALNEAAVTVTLLDANGVEVSGQGWPQEMTLVTGSRGMYRAVLAAALPLVPNARYTARIMVDAGVGLIGTWNMECVARTRN